MLFFAKRRLTGCTVLTALLLELLLNEHLVKKLIRRPRPFTLQPALDTVIPHPGSFSFPSGHTASSFAAATAIFMYDKKLGTAAYIVAALIGFSRNYFGVHYPTDVLAGALFWRADRSAGFRHSKRRKQAFLKALNYPTYQPYRRQRLS